MNRLFTITQETCAIGFQTHVTINPDKSIEDQLHRRKLYFRTGLDKGNVLELVKIIEWNSSLRIAFGWSFESTGSLNEIMIDCENNIKKPFVGNIIKITSDTRCDWIGFVPFNAFDKEYYKDLCIEDLITFNNRLIDYQADVVKYITQHTQYRYHSIVRDEWYRYNFFKKIRKDPVALSAAFQYYTDAVIGSSGVNSIPRDIIEQMIGCHFLYHPDIFFELLEFNILRGISMSDKEDLVAKIRAMPVEEIVKYETAAINTNRALNVIGVTIIFLVLMFPTIGMMIAGGFFTYIFANMSAGISQFLVTIREILSKKKINS